MRPVLPSSTHRRPSTTRTTRRLLIRSAQASALLALFSMASGFRAPLINDVATNLADPPAFLPASGIGPLPRSFTPQIEAGYPNLKTLSLSTTPLPVAAAAAARAAARMPRWAVTVADEGRVEGVATTLLLRFKDDFTFRLRPAGAGTLLDGRSRSRVGKGDFGANAARIAAFFALVEEEVGKGGGGGGGARL
jgi:uncharacterized protein (DUF1499 family)